MDGSRSSHHRLPTCKSLPRHGTNYPAPRSQAVMARRLHGNGVLRCSSHCHGEQWRNGGPRWPRLCDARMGDAGRQDNVNVNVDDCSCGDG